METPHVHLYANQIEEIKKMKLGTKARYAVMGVVDVALYAHGRPVPLSMIAHRQEISIPYLEQLFHKLKRRGILESVRGAAGGYRLGRPPQHITIMDIIAAVDEPLHATRCVPRETDGCMSQGSRCIVHHLWDRLGHHIQDYLASVTVADLQVNRNPTIEGVCHESIYAARG